MRNYMFCCDIWWIGLRFFSSSPIMKCLSEKPQEVWWQERGKKTEGGESQSRQNQVFYKSKTWNKNLWQKKKSPTKKINKQNPKPKKNRWGGEQNGNMKARLRRSALARTPYVVCIKWKRAKSAVWEKCLDVQIQEKFSVYNRPVHSTHCFPKYMENYYYYFFLFKVGGTLFRVHNHQHRKWLRSI